MSQRATFNQSRDEALIRVTNVFEGDALLDVDGGELTCTVDALRFEHDGERLSIPHTEIAETRVDLDKSVSGFKFIGNAFGVVAALMVYVFVEFVVIGGGSLASVIGGGSGVSAVLGFYGAVWIRRMEVGERVVLQVDCADGSRSVFITPDDGAEFDRIASRIT